MKLNYIIIPFLTFLVAAAGSMITGKGMEWYGTLNLPSFTPPGSVIGAVWTAIFLLSAASALLVWNRFSRGKRFNLIFTAFGANAILNVLWSCLFFGRHLLGLAVLEAGLLFASVLLLVLLIRPVSKAAAFLLYPYAFWTAFAACLTYAVWMLN